MKYYPGQVLVLKKSVPRTYRVVKQSHRGWILEFWENDCPDVVKTFEAYTEQMDKFLIPKSKLYDVLT